MQGNTGSVVNYLLHLKSAEHFSKDNEIERGRYCLHLLYQNPKEPTCSNSSAPAAVVTLTTCFRLV